MNSESKQYCNLCSLRFVSKVMFHKHLLTVHEKNGPPILYVALGESEEAKHSCKICHSIFAMKSHLKKHAKLDHKVKKSSSIVSTYNTSFTDKDMKTPKKFTRNLSLTDMTPSIKINKEKKAWICPTCQIQFLYQTTLSDHIKIVHGNIMNSESKNYCNLCSLRFVNKVMFHKHLITVHEKNGPPIIFVALVGSDKAKYSCKI